MKEESGNMENEKKEWFESEDFWTNYAPIMFDEQKWAEAPAIAEKVMEIAELKEGDTVLDAGCGVGRISVELAALGLDVTGVDIIQSELDTAKESAKDEGVELKLIKADLRTFKTEEHGISKKFDCAVDLYTSFGYCDTEEEDTEILKSIFDSLKDGGIFILENLSREVEIRYFTKGEEFVRAGKKVTTEFSVVGAWEGLRSHWTLTDIETGEVIDHEFVQRLYSAAELRKTLLKIGFKSVEIYGDFMQNPYDENMATMVLVCKK